jgi:hypothetical protein
MIFSYSLTQHDFVLFEATRYKHITPRYKPTLTILLVCRQLYVEYRLLPFSLLTFCFSGSARSTTRVIRALQPPQQAALRVVEVNADDMYRIPLEVLAGLRLLRVRDGISTSIKRMRRDQRSMRLKTGKEDLMFDWIDRRAHPT